MVARAISQTTERFDLDLTILFRKRGSETHLNHGASVVPPWLPGPEDEVGPIGGVIVAGGGSNHPTDFSVGQRPPGEITSLHSYCGMLSHKVRSHCFISSNNFELGSAKFLDLKTVIRVDVVQIRKTAARIELNLGVPKVCIFG